MSEVNERAAALLARLDELAHDRADIVQRLCEWYGLPERTIPKRGLYARLFAYNREFSANDRAIREAWIALLRLERADMSLVDEGEEGPLAAVEAEA